MRRSGDGGPQAQQVPACDFDMPIDWYVEKDPISLVAKRGFRRVSEWASAAAPANHGTKCVVILARFSGFISLQVPRDD